MNNFKNKILSFLDNLFIYKETNKYDFFLPEKESCEVNTQKKDEMDISKQTDYEDIFPNININLEYMQIKYNALINSDVVIREFNLIAKNNEYKAFLIYLDGMVDSNMINDFILKPLMLRNSANTYIKDNQNKSITIVKNNYGIKKVKKFNLEEYIFNSLVPQNSIKKYTKFKDAISDINSGNCILFVDTISTVFSLEVKGFKARSIGEPSNEIIVRGSQEAFVEVIRTNTSILRRLVNNENLIIENIDVGKISKTKVAVCYLNNIANEDLVYEVKYRINNLDIDTLISSGQLEQLIQDDSSIFPQLISTERPDKAVNYLFEGRVVVIVNGSPYVLIAPGVLVDYLSSPEDLNLKHQYSNILKLIRLIAYFFALLLPGLYIAITTYHQELIPTELLLAIASSRETVPFPLIFEIIIMELSFELIREAGLRVPSPIGPTIGIVGALILGEAAVSAGIVSPILIIIVAITGISSFAIPDFSLSFTLRLLRFVFLILGAVGGFLGIALGIFVYLCFISNLKSFGVPYTSPYIPNSNFTNSTTSFFTKPIWKREKRPSFLNPKKDNEEGKISMLWKKSKKEKE